MAPRTQPASPTQQDLLRDAMETLGMTRAEFAARLSVPPRTLDKWLLPEESTDFRAMPEMGKAYVREILHWDGQSKPGKGA
ncbi:aspartate carbamoyltransferase catalytic chain [Caballeronia mineralivorans PML1(12)]|uniref:Aspartate carbamoyltransferase catalytic chain n=1 Tax=Caballeronia mineralivorans PML1(12) TaxID=908627 RepID=A0A0J1CMC9_9BURK|nr:transcriptional regulator [Caballeronia mineralivorans]KLU21872.1 aspartate carbamoyltransferase catalytic chain [Caballeronia mineralivorans PML1(12)]